MRGPIDRFDSLDVDRRAHARLFDRGFADRNDFAWWRARREVRNDPIVPLLQTANAGSEKCAAKKVVIGGAGDDLYRNPGFAH